MTPSATATSCFNYFDKFLLPLSSQKEAAWIQDLELMHHYTIATSLTLPRANIALHIWQRRMPQLAAHYPFLVNQALAMAALHKSYLQPERRSEYSVLASQHQNRAIAGMRGHLAGITEQNCDALFMTSSLLLICAFAASANTTYHCRPASAQVSAGSPPMLHGASPINTTTGTSQGAPAVEEMLDVFNARQGRVHGPAVIRKEHSSRYIPRHVHLHVTTFLDAIVSELRAFETLLRHEHDHDHEHNQAHLDVGTNKTHYARGCAAH